MRPEDLAFSLSTRAFVLRDNLESVLKWTDGCFQTA